MIEKAKWIKTVGDIVDLIKDNAKDGDDELRAHATSLLGQRTRGSTTIFGLESLESAKPVEPVEVQNVAPGCVCFKVYAPEMRGKLGAIPLGDALFMHGANIKWRDGDHGPELYMDIDRPATHKQDHVYIIVGEHNGNIAVFTWHPGEPLGSLKDGINKSTAVKIHNG